MGGYVAGEGAEGRERAMGVVRGADLVQQMIKDVAAHGITTMFPVCFLAIKAVWAARSSDKG